MTEKDVISKCLTCFNISYDKIGADSDEVAKCNEFLRQAEGMCARYRDWSFLHESLQYEDKDIVEGESWRNLCYAYRKPSHMVKVRFINGEYNENMYILGNYIYTDVKNPKITYITDDPGYSTDRCPDLYFDMIAYMLATLVSTVLRPDDSAIQQKISGMYTLAYQTLTQSEIDASRMKNPPQDAFVVGAPSYPLSIDPFSPPTFKAVGPLKELKLGGK